MTSVGDYVASVNAADGEYYKILGVEKTASDSDIKKAYRKIALKLHPDKTDEAGAEDAFKKVGEAYACLSDMEKRKMYDLTGKDGGDSGPGGGGHPFGGMDADEIFKQFFANFDQNGMGPGGRMPSGAQTFHFGTGGPGFQSGFHPFFPADRSGSGGGGGGGGGGRGNAAGLPQVDLPDWVVTALKAIPWNLVAPILVFFGLYYVGVILKLLTQLWYIIFPILYLTPKWCRWWLVLLIITCKYWEFFPEYI